ncbi:substrate binding protein of glycine betaine ABC transport system [Rhizobium sp. ERR 922]|nr:substrate binding protein of glycine betaine ABC transport system [Rhizobium sp. ERR 922]TWB91011.1 substrate binding protein of glycine betaine ABC transport system [Rhizobium sp. ERR 942]
MNSYPVSIVLTVVTKQFAERSGVAPDYLKTRKWDNKTVGKILACMDANQGTNEDGAKYFLQTYPDLWMKWVWPDVAEKVKASL